MLKTKVIKEDNPRFFEEHLNNKISELKNLEYEIQEIRTFGSDGYIIAIIFYKEKF